MNLNLFCRSSLVLVTLLLIVSSVEAASPDVNITLADGAGVGDVNNSSATELMEI